MEDRTYSAKEQSTTVKVNDEVSRTHSLGTRWVGAAPKGSEINTITSHGEYPTLMVILIPFMYLLSLFACCTSMPPPSPYPLAHRQKHVQLLFINPRLTTTLVHSTTYFHYCSICVPYLFACSAFHHSSAKQTETIPTSNQPTLLTPSSIPVTSFATTTISPIETRPISINRMATTGSNNGTLIRLRTYIIPHAPTMGSVVPGSWCGQHLSEETPDNYLLCNGLI